MGINLNQNNLIYPYFVVSGKNKKEKINNFPNIFRFSVDRVLKDVEGLKRNGVYKILLFGIPDKKDEEGRGAYETDGPVSQAVRAIKKEHKDIIVMTDVCLCAYTTHGHCGILQSGIPSPTSKVNIDNTKTLEALAKIAVRHAEAGADWVAPSAMAQGQVRAIREALDINGFKKTKIMGYSAKFASSFYGPFREAADSAPQFGDRRGYQLDYSDVKKALSEIEADIKEGADMVMVKPALAYLDVIKEAKQKFRFPLAAYNVSGEYAMVRYGAQKGLWAEKKMVFEIMTSIRRAGADLIITYHAKDAAKWLKRVGIKKEWFK